MKFVSVLVITFLFVSCNRGPDGSVKREIGETQTAETEYQKEMEEVRKSIKGEVKIKLKRDGKGLYTWEIMGKDAQEIIKVNETLRKRLSE
jgi:hypothetical protein